MPLGLIDCRLASIELAHLAKLQISNEGGDQYTEQSIERVQHAEDNCQFGLGLAVLARTGVELAGEIIGRHDDAFEEVVDGLSKSQDGGMMR